MRTRAELREAVDPLFVALRGVIRRMGVSLGAGSLWQFVGVRMSDGKTETRNAETFSGIGFYSQPSSSGKPEAIVVMVGDANSPACVATRDEATRQASVGDLAADEAAIFNSLVRVHCKADGTIELKTVLGIAEKMIKGETYRTAEDTLFAAMATIINTIGGLAVLLQAATPTLTGSPANIAAYNTAAAALPVAITNYDNAVIAFNTAALTYLARVGKVE